MAQLHLSLLAKQRTKSALRSALGNLSIQLSDVYDDIMARISAKGKEDAEIAMKVLKWITYAREPLRPAVVQHAVSIALDSTEIHDDDLFAVEDLISLCVGIVTVDRESGIMRLVHYTAQNYLESRWPNANTDIATGCLTYLGFDVFKESCEDEEALEQRLSQYALIRYAVKFWGEHARGEPEKNLQAMVLQTFRNQGTRDSTRQIMNKISHWSDFRSSFNMSLLHVLCINGLPIIAASLLEDSKIESQEMNATDIYGRTPLIWAAENGHAEVVELLLKAGANIEAKDERFGQPPLICAARKGYTEVIKVLLKAGANIEAKDEVFRQSPLIWAAENGLAEASEVLLKAGARIEVKNDAFGYYSLLIWAAENGLAEAIELLLKAGANVQPDTVGQSPLLYATVNEHTEAVKLLLKEGANIEALHEDGWSPLHRAAWSGSLQILTLFHRALSSATCSTDLSDTSVSDDGYTDVVSILKSLTQKYSNDSKLERALGNEYLRQKKYANARAAFDMSTLITMRNTNATEIRDICADVLCDLCATEIRGYHYKCMECYWDYDMCEFCIQKLGHKHSADKMIRIPSEALLIQVRFL
jgi:ankyrin repeat protein